MDDADFELRNLFGLLRRQARLIIITVVLVVGVAALIVYSLTPKYTASAMLLVDTSQKNLLDPGFQGTNQEIDSARIDSEVEIVQSTSILNKVIDRMKLISDPEFGVKLSTTDRIMGFLQLSRPTLATGDAAVGRVLAGLRNEIDVRRLAKTNLIQIFVTAENAAKASDIANVWAAAYIEDQIAAKVVSTLSVRDVLQSQLEQARVGVVTAEGAFDKFLDENMNQIVEETGRTDVANLRGDLSSASSQRAGAAQQIELIQASLAARNYSAIAQSLQSEAVRELDRQWQALNAQAAQISEGQAVNLRDELAKVEQRLVDAASGEIATLRNSVSTSQAREGEIRQQIRTAVLSSALSPDILARIYELQQSSELSRTQYQTLLGRIQDMDAQANLQVADSRVVSASTVPARPSFPNINVTLALATLSSLGLGIVLAFVRENILGGILTEEQAAAVLRIPLAASLLREKGTARAGGPGGLADYIVQAPLTPFAEGIRRVKIAIDRTLHRDLRGADQGGDGIVVLVTSSTASEGKSTIALSVARAYALSHTKTLLIDCDLRKPTTYKILGLPQSEAMVDLLSNGRQVEDLAPLVQADPLSELKVILGSRPSEVATDQLVTSRSFLRLIEKARAEFDVVIIDSPPVGPVVDGLYMMQLADIGLFVVKSGTTSQTEARMTLATLREVNASAKVLAILNQQDRASASYKGKYDSYYFSETA